MTTQTTQTEQLSTAQIVRTINKCIETCTDGEKGYAAAAADVREPALKDLLHGYSMQRAGFVRELQQEIEKLDAFPENQGTAKGAAHRGFISARMAIEGRTDAVILSECERGEMAALAAYDRAVSKTPIDLLPIEVRKILIEQRSAIQTAYEVLTNQDISRRRMRGQHGTA